MEKIKTAIIGYGNIGRYAVQALTAAPDMELKGVVRRNITEEQPEELAKIHVTNHISKLGKVDVALLCIPSTQVEQQTQEILRLGIHTVDCFDIHSRIPSLQNQLSAIAIANHAVAVIASGWDPGSDSIVRALLEAIAPRGITYTDFGPGMSMGHSVAVKAIEGVQDALAVTVPVGTGIHRRMVYVTLKPGSDIHQITQAIRQDPYFCHDETIVTEVPCIEDLLDTGHGVTMSRKGVCGQTANQRFEFRMSVNNPALTSQVMVACARATMRMAQKQGPGAYTMIEIPVVDLLPGHPSDWIRKLV